MSNGSFRSGGARVSNLAGIADRTPVNRQVTHGLRAHKRDPGFCPLVVSVEQVECQFDNLFRGRVASQNRASAKP